VEAIGNGPSGIVVGPSGVLVARAWSESGTVRVRVTATVEPAEGRPAEGRPTEGDGPPAATVSVVVDSYDGFLAVIQDWFGRLAAPPVSPGRSPRS
jgi:hypothetical protein